MNDPQDSAESGRGAFAELREAVGGLIGQITSIVPGRSLLFSQPFPSHELEIEDDGFSLWVELPGLKREDVEVSVAGRTVTVSGEREKTAIVEGSRILRNERPVGPFDLKVELPDEADPLAVVARIEDGLLHVRLPKFKEARGRKIKVGESKQKGGSTAKRRSSKKEGSS